MPAPPSVPEPTSSTWPPSRRIEKEARSSTKISASSPPFAAASARTFRMSVSSSIPGGYEASQSLVHPSLPRADRSHRPEKSALRALVQEVRSVVPSESSAFPKGSQMPTNQSKESSLSARYSADQAERL